MNHFLETGRIRKLDPLQLEEDKAEIARVQREYSRRNTRSVAQWYAGIVADAKASQAEHVARDRVDGRKAAGYGYLAAAGLFVVTILVPPVAPVTGLLSAGLVGGSTGWEASNELSGKFFDKDDALAACEYASTCRPRLLGSCVSIREPAVLENWSLKPSLLRP
jgi:hypothetical protein